MWLTRFSIKNPTIVTLFLVPAMYPILMGWTERRDERRRARLADVELSAQADDRTEMAPV